jgi:hypothetical protein
VFQYQCDPNPGLTGTGSVYGTDTYYVTSSVCPAALHAGRITAAAGGIVTVRIGAVAGPYNGSTRNGITSITRASGSCSFTFDP